MVKHLQKYCPHRSYGDQQEEAAALQPFSECLGVVLLIGLEEKPHESTQSWASKLEPNGHIAGLCRLCLGSTTRILGLNGKQRLRVFVEWMEVSEAHFIFQPFRVENAEQSCSEKHPGRHGHGDEERTVEPIVSIALTRDQIRVEPDVNRYIQQHVCGGPEGVAG